jgi:SAM-dependent methyltransferase
VPRLPGSDLLGELGHRVPRDHARQWHAHRYVERAVGKPASGPWRVLDLGCGDGNSVELFRLRDPDVEWVGIDIERSPEVAERTRTDARFATFDGIAMPFPDASFDTVYCKQVLEHVRDPVPLFDEARRVLAPGGWFVGSTSQLEPYHSHSVWNYTPSGLAMLLERAGFAVVELRPSMDGLTLITRRGLRGPRVFERWWSRESPLNKAIALTGRVVRASPAQVNAAKLVFAGQFCFAARAAGDSDSPA